MAAVLEYQGYFDRLRAEIQTHTFGASYATGGESVLPSFGNTVLALAECAAGYVGVYDYTNKKMKVFYADNNGASDSALIEVPATTNLSAVAMKILFLGT